MARQTHHDSKWNRPRNGHSPLTLIFVEFYLGDAGYAECPPNAAAPSRMTSAGVTPLAVAIVAIARPLCMGGYTGGYAFASVVLVDAPIASTDLGNRILKVDHAGEHGAICVYRAQRWIAVRRSPTLVAELDEFLTHERRHRDLFAAEMARRGLRRCRSFHFCGLGGLTLGFLTGLIGSKAVAATTVAIEGVVLRHLDEQVAELKASDPGAAATIAQIIADEQQHHDVSLTHFDQRPLLYRGIRAVVSASTELVIWLGMKL